MAKVAAKQKKSAAPKGPALEAHQVIVRPLVTEKGTHLVERYNTYLFQVHPQATKSQIKGAVEVLFEVSVEEVRTIKRKGKPRRYRQRQVHRADTKRALVKLSENDRIALF